MNYHLVHLVEGVEEIKYINHLVHFVERVLQHAHLPHVPGQRERYFVCFYENWLFVWFFRLSGFSFVRFLSSFSFSYFAASGSSKTNWTLYSKSWHSIPKYRLWFTWCVWGRIIKRSMILLQQVYDDDLDNSHEDDPDNCYNCNL